MKKNLSYLISIIIALVLCYFAFRNISLKELINTSKGASVPLVAVVFIFTALGQVLRGLRWKLLLKPLGYEPSNAVLVSSVFLGYMVNLVLPRAGEIARCANLERLEGVPTEKSFGAVVAERFIDVLLLLMFLVLNVFLEFDRLKSLLFSMVSVPKFNITYLATGLVLFMMVTLIAFFYRKTIFSKINENRLLSKILAKFIGFKDGLSSVFKIKSRLLFIVYSLSIWLSYLVIMYLLLVALPLGYVITFKMALSCLVIGSVGMAVPSLGGLGSYHLLVTAILMQYGVSEKDGMIMATFQHTLNGILFVIILGIMAVLYNLWKKP